MFRRRQGFTLVELLVVIAIIGVLVALLLPAVQAAREAGRRTVCKNHLKQIGLAIHNHVDALQMLPHGSCGWWLAPSSTNGVTDVGSRQQAGWQFQILPYLEQGNVFDQVASGTPGQIVAFGTPIETYFCPTRGRPRVLPPTPNWYNPPGNFAHAQTDYAGSNWENTGAIIYLADFSGNGATINLGHIVDGTSNTFIAAEKRLDKTYLGQYMADDNEGYCAGWNHDTSRLSTSPPARDTNNGSGFGFDIFGSSHSTAMQSVFSDGAVKSISYSINATTFNLLSQIADGQAVTPP